jgi:hypothetical protein
MFRNEEILILLTLILNLVNAQQTPTRTPTPTPSRTPSPSRSPASSYLDPRIALTLFKNRNGGVPLYEEGYIFMVTFFLLITLVLLTTVCCRVRKYLRPQPASSATQEQRSQPITTSDTSQEDPKEINVNSYGNNSGVLVNPLAAASESRNHAPVSPASLPSVKPLYTTPTDQRPDVYLLNKVHPLLLWIGIINFFVFFFGFVVAYAPWVVTTLPPPYSNYQLELTLYNVYTVPKGYYTSTYYPPISNTLAYKNKPYDRASSDAASLSAAFFFAHCYWVAAIAMIQGFVAHRAVRAKYTLIKRGRNRPNCCMNCCDCPDCCCDCCPICFSNASCAFRLNFAILFCLFITICAGTAPFEYTNTENLRPTGVGLGFAIFCFLLSFIATSLAGGAVEMLLDASFQPGNYALRDLAEGGENTTVAQITSGFDPQILPTFHGDLSSLVIEMRSRQQSQQLLVLQKLHIPLQQIGGVYSQSNYPPSNVMLPQQMIMAPQPRMEEGFGYHPQMGAPIGAYSQPMMLQDRGYPQPMMPQNSGYPQIMSHESYTIPSTTESPPQGVLYPQVVPASSHGLSPAQFAELEARRKLSRGQAAETSAMRRADSVTSARMTPEQKELHALRNAQARSSFPPLSASVTEISVVPTSPPPLPMKR